VCATKSFKSGDTDDQLEEIASSKQLTDLTTRPVESDLDEAD
jgi:hypothetical protein